MGKIDGVSAIALILLASFAIDRVVSASLFLLSYTRLVPDPSLVDGSRDRASAEKTYKLVYFALAGLLGIVALALFGKIRILAAMGIPADDLLDILLTGVVLVGGADRIAAVLKAPGVSGSEQAQPKPIVITGDIKLIEPRQTAGGDR